MRADALIMTRCADALKSIGANSALRFVGLRWGQGDWNQLCAALPYCPRLEEVVLSYMTTLKSSHLENLIRVMPEGIRLLNLEHCSCLWKLPSLEKLEKLETLILTGCSALSSLPWEGWENLSRIQKIDLFGCEMLKHDDVAAIVHGLSKERYDSLTLIMPGVQSSKTRSPR